MNSRRPGDGTIQTLKANIWTISNYYYFFFVTEPKYLFLTQETYPHWAKYTAQTSKKKPCRNRHPKVCTEAKKSIENNPEMVITKSRGNKMRKTCRTLSKNSIMGNS